LLVRRGEEGIDRSRQCCRVFGGDEHPGIAHHFGKSRYVGCDDRFARRHGFDDGDSKPLKAGNVHVDVGHL